jgi:hypothetical protein
MAPLLRQMRGVARFGVSACLYEDKGPSLLLLAQVTLKPAKPKTEVVSTGGQAKHKRYLGIGARGGRPRQRR